MKIKNYSFLSAFVDRELSNFKQTMFNLAESSEILSKEISENTPVIRIEDFLKLLNEVPRILVYQASKRRLDGCHVHGLERDHYKKKLVHAGDIEKYLRNFNSVDPLSEDVISQMIKALSGRLGKTEEKDSVIRVHDLIPNADLDIIIASILFEVDGFNTFYGIYYVDEIYNLMSQLDFADNLYDEESILPVHVFRDYVDIRQSIEMILEIEDFMAGEQSSLGWFYDTSDLEGNRRILEKRLRNYVVKYPILEAERISEFDTKLLDTYMKTPGEMVAIYGGDIICFPFKASDEQGIFDNDRS